MKNILFVDDESNVIQGILRMLRPMRKEWKIFSANSGKEALELMTGQKIDVVVSDMRMPEMDGAELLEIVKDKYPQVIRIILSGQSEKEMILKSVKPAHQFLSKPCDAETLKKTIIKALHLRTLLHNEKMTNLVSRIDSLPSLPALYTQIIEKLNEEESSLQDIAQIIKKDVSMTAEILKLVNSSFFGFFNKISNIEQAVSLLGIIMIKTLVLSIKLFSQFPKMDQISISIDELWNHSFATGIFAGKMVYDLTNDKQKQENAFTAGLLHDIGIITLASQLPQTYKKAYDNAFINKTTIAEGEYKFFESSHAEVGAYLAGLWGFPDEITDAIAYHHIQNSNDEKIELLTLIIHCADIFIQKLSNKNLGLQLEQIHEKVLRDSRYQQNHEHWLNLCSEIYDGDYNE
jgi:putative nucleotidyltransferase with HDIG domain